MAELEDLRGRTFRWEPALDAPRDLILLEGDAPRGRISPSPCSKPLAHVEVAGTTLKIAWTEHDFYRITDAGSGRSVGEARYLPWRRDTFQARMGHLRAYRLQRPSSDILAWEIGGARVMEFAGGRAEVAHGIEPADAAPLLALGILLRSTETPRPA